MLPAPRYAPQPATMHAARIVLRCRFTFSVQDACGAQPLVTLFEGHSLRYGAAIVDVQTATVTVASWQVRCVQHSCISAYFSFKDQLKRLFDLLRISVRLLALCNVRKSHPCPITAAGGGHPALHAARAAAHRRPGRGACSKFDSICPRLIPRLIRMWQEHLRFMVDCRMQGRAAPDLALQVRPQCSPCPRRWALRAASCRPTRSACCASWTR